MEDYIKEVDKLTHHLISEFGFNVKQKLHEEALFLIEYSSENFTIKIEKYFREFYISLYKEHDLDNETNLFNLLEYLMQNADHIPNYEYFRNEKTIEESYKKQINYLCSIICENFDSINDFFCDNKYEIKIAEFDEFWRTKHPELY